MPERKSTRSMACSLTGSCAWPGGDMRLRSAPLSTFHTHTSPSSLALTTWLLLGCTAMSKMSACAPRQGAKQQQDSPVTPCRTQT